MHAMTDIEFQRLCRDACVALDLDDPETLQTHGELEIDGVAIAVHFEEEEDPDCIYCYVDLGRPDEQQRTLVFERLLEMNVRNGLNTAGIFSFDSVSGHACSCLQLRDLEVLDGNFMAEMLRFFAKESLSARELVRAPQSLAESASVPPASSGDLMPHLV